MAPGKSMKRFFLATTIVALIAHEAPAFWNSSTIDREAAAKAKLPLKIVITPTEAGMAKVDYEIMVTGEFAHLRSATVAASDGKKALFSIKLVGHPGAPVPQYDNGPAVVKGQFLVSKEVLTNCRLYLECPIGVDEQSGLSLTSGHTMIVQLGSYLK